MKIVGLVLHKEGEIGGIRFEAPYDLIAYCLIDNMRIGDIDGEIVFIKCVFENCDFSKPFIPYEGDFSKESPMPKVKRCILRNCKISSKYFLTCIKTGAIQK